MMSAAKIKESGKRKGKEKKIRNAKTELQISDVSECVAGLNIHGNLKKDVIEGNFQQSCNNSQKNLETWDVEQDPMQVAKSEYCQSSASPDEIVFDVSLVLDGGNVTNDNPFSQEFHIHENLESKEKQSRDEQQDAAPDFCTVASEITIKALDYSKVINELKNCMDNIIEPSAPITDVVCCTKKEPESLENVPSAMYDISDVEVSKPIKEVQNIINLQCELEAESCTPLSETELSQYYYNTELNQVQEFTSSFIKEEINNEAKFLHPFYKLLSNYLKAKSSFQVTKNKIKDLEGNLDKYINEMWTVWNNIEVCEVKKCMDGNSVKFSQKYTQAHFNLDTFQNFKSALNDIKSSLFETFKIDSFNCLKYKLHIQQYVHSLLTSCPEFTNLNEASQISLQQPSSDSYFQQCLSNLRISIGILFLFQRKHKVDMSTSFLEESREWLTDLVSVLIRAGNWKDHLFILSHVLRCPGGVGKWASLYIQFPTSSSLCDPFSDPVINHVMAVMSILLQPVERREEFMNEWSKYSASEENSWVMIDSEEEDEAVMVANPLKENDMVLMLNQIPMKNLFSSVLGVKNGKLNCHAITANHLMKLFSFSSDFIKILNSGLQIYSTQRYKQFAKRLGCLIRHIIEYATDELDLYKSSHQEREIEIWKRLQVEYDTFFLKSARSIYSSRIYGTWQFLAVIPYHLASRMAILKLYSSLQLNEVKNDTKIEINLTYFAEQFNMLPQSEQFYLLSAFTSMALARNLKELEFIKAVVHQLLYIGFLSNLTKDQCYKNVKSLLHNLCAKHPFLMTEILLIQDEYFISCGDNDQYLSVYLWKELPVRTWKPVPDDFRILSSWLVQPLQSARNELARIILKSLNYGIEEGELFLPVETHRTIAYIILKAQVTAPQEQEMNVMKNVSSLVGLQEPEQVLHVWSWNILLQLHLHLLDQSPNSVRDALQNLNEKLRDITELVSNGELHELVKAKNPVACFIALMTTTLGHSVPVIFNEGFALLEVLIRARKYEAAIVCMEYITLLFLECPESLYRCQHFTSILAQLLNSDYSYLKLAKNIKPFETPGPILLCLENMIQNQIYRCEELCINRKHLIALWIKSLTKLPLWTQEPGVIHLLDLLFKNSFFDKNASLAVSDIMRSSLMESSSPTESKSSLASLVNWMNNKSTVPTLLARVGNCNSVWFFLKVIDIEQDIYESRNFLWNELLKELWSVNTKKTNVDSCLKKVCANLQIPVRTSETLTIYRLCHQILETKVTHPLIIVLWQKFFLLYFHRVPELAVNASVGAKFFDGIFNQNLLKKLKHRLKETADCFTELQKKCSESSNRSKFFFKCSEVLHVFQLWLDEPKLHEPHLNVHLLSPQFNRELLGKIINQNKSLWTEYMDYCEVQNEINRCVFSWQALKNRRNKSELRKASTALQEKSLTDKIQDGLMRYENPLPAPCINKQKYACPVLQRYVLLNSDSMDSYLKPSFKNILDYAEYFMQEIGEYVSLSCDLQDLVQLLYVTKKSSITLRKTCDGNERVINGRKINVNCSGPAVIKLEFNESEQDQKSHELFNKCQRNFNRCLQRSLMPVQQSLGLSVVAIEKAIEELKSQYSFMKNHSGDEKNHVSGLRKTGVKLFYDFIESWSESILSTPAVTILFQDCVDSLGKTFIMDNAAECNSFLNAVSEHYKLIDKLHTYFDPNVSSTQDFIELYAKVKKCHPEVKLILLSKFDLPRWLLEKRPRYSERSLLISEIGSGLKCHGIDPTDNLDLVKLFNAHLRHILMYDFPEHYGQILNLLLEGSESQTIPVSTWFEFLNAIVPEGIHFVGGKYDGNNFEPGQPLKKLKLFFTQYATQQKLLHLSDIRETIIHLGNAFKLDRLKHGLYGLYPKYRLYVEPILILSGMMSHAYVAETLKLDLGSLSVRIADQLWPLLRDLYSPWLVPYWSKQEKAQTAKWIQELTDDKCVLLPWINSDISFASYSCSIFIYSIRFVLDTLPGINSILSHTWFFYVTNYAHIQVKDYVLCVIHKNLLLLPWCNFFPSLQDIELMVKVVEHFIPMVHSLLGNIFVEVKWTQIVQYYSSQTDTETLSKLHICLLHLLVKLPCEPTLKQSSEVISLLSEAKDYLWHLVDSGNYDCVLNWFVMSCDPRIVLMDENSEYYKLDLLILQILRTCAGFSETKEFHKSTLTKRLMYIRANNKWLVVANNRFKCKDSSLFKLAVFRIMNEIESTVNLSMLESQKSEELATLISEFLNIFKEEELSAIVEEVILDWLSSKRCDTLIYGLLRSISISAIKPSIFGNIAEACLTSYFDSNDESNWNDITSRFVMYASDHSGLQKSLINNNNLLTLYAIILKHFNDSTDLLEKKTIVSDIFRSITSAKRCESVEPKLVLMIVYVCKIADIVSKVNEAEGMHILFRLAGHLVNFINDKGNGILSTFGLRKRESFTNRFKFVCFITTGGIMRLFKTFNASCDEVDETVLRSVDQALTSKQYHNIISQYSDLVADEMEKVESVEDIIKVLKTLGLLIFNKNYLK